MDVKKYDASNVWLTAPIWRLITVSKLMDNNLLVAVFFV